MNALVVGLSVWTVLSLVAAAALGCVLTGARRVEARALAAVAARAGTQPAAAAAPAVQDALPVPRVADHDVPAPLPA